NLIRLGSTGHGIHMYENDKYYVMLELEFPFYEEILVRPDQHRPGMVHLDFENCSFNSFTSDTLLDYRCYLHRGNLHTWIQGILTEICSQEVRGEYEWFNLRYKRTQDCHNIYAESPSRTFSISIKPSITIVFEDSVWHAVPGYMPGPKRSNNFTFMMIDLHEELERFGNGSNLIKDAVILVKALCESKALCKITYDHLISTAIQVVEEDMFEQYTLQNAFIAVLATLIDDMENNQLTYFCNPDLNLLSHFQPQVLKDYINKLDSAYNTLKTYPYQYNLSYERCSEHFT
ncbi:hypothetical protein KR018_007761, partial [Drosophila ironensis]